MPLGAGERLGPYEDERQTDCTHTAVRGLTQLVLAVVSLTTTYAAVDQPKQELHPYRQHWKHSTFGMGALGGVVAKAGIGQAFGHPRNYGGGLGGFGKRKGASRRAPTIRTRCRGRCLPSGSSRRRRRRNGGLRARN